MSTKKALGSSVFIHSRVERRVGPYNEIENEGAARLSFSTCGPDLLACSAQRTLHLQFQPSNLLNRVANFHRFVPRFRYSLERFWIDIVSLPNFRAFTTICTQLFIKLFIL